MVSNNKNLQNLIPSSSKTLTIATTSSDTEDKEKNPNATSLMDSSESITPITIDGAEEDAILLDSAFLTRHEVNRRRLRRTKQLVRIFKDQYWAMMDEVRVAFRDYYWKYGKSPYQEDEVVDKLPSNGGGDGNEDNNHQKLGFKDNAAAGGIDGFVKRCVFAGCKIKAMPLTNYCHPHILADQNQKLYKPCTYIIKSNFDDVGSSSAGEKSDRYPVKRNPCYRKKKGVLLGKECLVKNLCEATNIYLWSTVIYGFLSKMLVRIGRRDIRISRGEVALFVFSVLFTAKHDRPSVRCCYMT